MIWSQLDFSVCKKGILMAPSWLHLVCGLTISIDRCLSVLYVVFHTNSSANWMLLIVDGGRSFKQGVMVGGRICLETTCLMLLWLVSPWTLKPSLRFLFHDFETFLPHDTFFIRRSLRNEKRFNLVFNSDLIIFMTSIRNMDFDSRYSSGQWNLVTPERRPHAASHHTAVCVFLNQCGLQLELWESC